MEVEDLQEGPDLYWGPEPVSPRTSVTDQTIVCISSPGFRLTDLVFLYGSELT